METQTIADISDKNNADARNLLLNYNIDDVKVLAILNLLDLEKSIIRIEYMLTKLPENAETNTQRLYYYVKEYEFFRSELGKRLQGEFDDLYNKYKLEHNIYARENLDKTNGHIYCYVLPRFNKDGTHQMWGENDVPWNQYGN